MPISGVNVVRSSCIAEAVSGAEFTASKQKELRGRAVRETAEKERRARSSGQYSALVTTVGSGNSSASSVFITLLFILAPN